MKKRGMTFLMMILVMFSLAGCGTQEKKQPSDRIKTETNEPQQADTRTTVLKNKHNQYNAYRICGENAIQQLDLEGNLVHTFEITKGSDLLEIACVANEEILYLLDSGDQVELWSIPLTQKDSTDEVQVEEKKFIFRTQNMINILYADRDYIAYKELSAYKEFDRTKQKKMVINVDHKEISYCQPDNFNIQAVQSENQDDDGTILLAKNVGEDQYPKNIYVHKVGSGKVDRVAQTYTSKDHMVSIAYSEDKIYYTGLVKNWRNEKQSWDIWCYDCRTNKSYCMVLEKQMKATASFSEIVALYINDHEIWIETANKKSKYLHCPLVPENESADLQIKKAEKMNQHNVTDV